MVFALALAEGPKLLSIDLPVDDIGQTVVGGGLVAALIVLFRVLLAGLRNNYRDVNAHNRTLAWERDRAEQLAAWERRRGDHFMATAYGASVVPPHPEPWVEPPRPADLLADEAREEPL